MPDFALAQAEITHGPGIQVRQLGPLACAALISQYLKTKQLVRPFKISSPAEFGYYFVCLPERFKEPKISAFRNWLVETIASLRPERPERPE